MSEEKKLALFSETEYDERAPNGYPVSCPTLDLSATWDSTGRNLFIYRPPKQAVSKIHQVGAPGQKAPEAQAVTWKPDGQFLAVGWSDGFVRLMGLENNKAAHHIQVCESPGTRITHIGWASSNIAAKSTSAVAQAIRNGLSKEGSLSGDDAPMDLPRELTFLEVDTALPKISPLPSASAGAGEDAMVFTLRTGIDFLFQPLKPEDYDQVNVMVIGTSDSKLQLSIYDSFIIGSFPCPTLGASAAPQLVHHASHPQVSTHALLLADKAEGPEEVHLVPMDLPFISSSPINLSLLASKLTTLQKLLRYLKQTQLHMEVEWKNTRELPSRFLRSVEGDLENMERGPRGIVPALYHTVVTGHAYGPVREWLVDSLAERGHKRWDKAVVSGLENLRSLVHENFLPALDRCSIILSRLRGLAQFYDTRDDIGFSATQINRVMDIISCLNLVGHKILISVMDELEHFTSFSTWLRFQIDRLASSSSAIEELTEKEATMDHGKVLTYIERYLTESPLKIFFDEIEKDDYSADWAHIEDGPSLLDVLDKQLTNQENGQPSMKALPHVDFLVKYVTTWSNRIFKDIAEAKKRNVRFGKPIKLSVGNPITKMDTRMCRTTSNDMKMVTALTSKETSHQVRIFSAGIDIVNGISNNLPPTSCCIDLGSRTLVDLKFLNDETLIVLVTDKDNVFKALSVPILPDKLAYGPYDPSNATEATPVSADDFMAYSFPEGPVLRPVRMEVHDKSDIRGEVPARVCLLESNGSTLRTFALPGPAA
ncbi:anaphase-promoting complex, cyclosome, subunit 4-domain-containing protein [Ilyonectria robusta]|uniref:anaphase-promoting complex, cyclosome, subunit 4-domain-containing protein n=1 Tax=Ilyonectria robusta TaxID=1079257 RepID=UPI001E8E3EAC|nr:anaphase-promoting complex, cyclosome, subunit 4-domain-containing protein [Ilyonectria robusta]KAH8686721.1 anaphase-promoting complex, cyclosome, subunit 4-domain-containing protein [Ilyonectria robusta]